MGDRSPTEWSATRRYFTAPTSSKLDGNESSWPGRADIAGYPERLDVVIESRAVRALTTAPSVVMELSSYRVPVDSPIVPEPAPTTRRLWRSCKKLITRTFAEFQSIAHGTKAVVENVCS